MKNRLKTLMSEKDGGLLSVYFTAGYPTLNSVEEVITTLDKAGVDMIEIGIPFSDPMADGPIIQESSTIALRNGITLKGIFSQLKDIRKQTNIPLVMMGYLNPIIQFGLENFCKACQEVGIDGVIIPDLPFSEYMQEYKSLGEKYGLDFIMLITPETSEERIMKIDENISGFIYMVSTASTTGAKDSFDENTIAYFNRINNMKLKNPRLIGFGISNKGTFENAISHAKGAIIGSAFIKQLSSQKTIKEAVDALIKQIS